MSDDHEGWCDIEFEDVPSREELAEHILDQLSKGRRTSRQMRDAWRRARKLTFGITTGAWNATPTDKLVNEHAWVLVDLQDHGLIRNLGGPINEELYELM